MPNIKSAEKRVRQADRAEMRNKSVKSGLASMRRKLYEAIEAGLEDESKKLFTSYCSAVDKAANKKVIKANAASRRKSRAHARVVAMTDA